jgi:antitoxin VapB
MALSIRTEEADRLARTLAKLTGETITQAVTNALRERLDREQVRREAAGDLPARRAALSERLRGL